MQEEKPTNSDEEEQTKQIACRMGQKENSIKIKFVNHPITQALIALVVMYLLIAIAPQLLVHGAMESYNNNTTTANMYITSANGFLIAFLTFIYILLTGSIVTQSKNAVAQSRKEQQIRDIENRLEKFYIPADDIISGKFKKNHEQTINGWPPTNEIGLKHLRKYSYLSNKTTFEVYETYITTDCKSLKSMTCKDNLDQFNDFRCQKRMGNCCQSWDKCNENLEYCEHFNECPEKDHKGIIKNNTLCNYYIDLKEKIT